MNVSEALARRYTCRAFKTTPVDPQHLFNIMEAANQSPSWGNTQPWEIFVASGACLERLREAYTRNFESDTPLNPELSRPEDWPPEMKGRYQELGKMRLTHMNIARDDEQGRRFNMAQNFNFFGAPVVAFLCMDRTLTHWSLFDLGIIAQSIMLGAQQYGLDSAVAVQFASYPDLVRAELNIPDNLCIAIGIALGYGDASHVQNQVRSRRRPVEQAVRFKDA